jgi:hypothetical protein
VITGRAVDLLDAADELANLISPTLDAYLLSSVEDQMDEPILETSRVSKNGMLAKFSPSQKPY